jgi:succinyl-CoA synthetase beta subunit
MNLEEHAAKPLLAAAGIAVPDGEVVSDPAGAARAAAKLGPCVVKAQVAAGRRGKAGGIRAAATPAEAGAAAEAILGLTIGGYRVARLLVERRIDVQRELYAAVLTDAATKGPLILASASGGIDVEELAERAPDHLLRIPVDIRQGITSEEICGQLDQMSWLGLTRPSRLDPRVKPEGDGEGRSVGQRLADLLAKLYRVYAASDAELVEINPLALTADSALVALDCKLVIDDAAAPRRPELAALATPELRTPLEQRAQAQGLRLIELDGDIGVLANGAGLTMTTMDAVRHYGGAPANFLEIGGEAYRLGRPALEVVLANPKVRSLVVNFCGAFARTDVMTAGIVEAWQALRPAVPVFFSIHGTGEDTANALVRERLGLEPFDLMDDAVRAAVEAAR